MAAAQKCVHQSCGKIFTDPDEECHYHPGPPVFHEGQKGKKLAYLISFKGRPTHSSSFIVGWKCCKPRFLTFEEFQSIPPCTVGKHSTTEFPLPVEKTEGASISTAPTPVSSAEPTRVPLNAAQATPPPPPPAVEEPEDDDPALPIKEGTTCKRIKCGVQYTPEVRAKREKGEKEECVHHPGAPIFHEGSKGYSCCKRRVLEFDEFMKIEGCTVKDKHLFVGSGEKGKQAGNDGEETVETVRYVLLLFQHTVEKSKFGIYRHSVLYL